MTMQTTAFLGGAKDRLLPAAIPFRFFLSALLFHVAAWVVLFLAADDVAWFRGGTGPTLAAIHLLTLGTLAMTAIGASLQLFPVVTRRALGRTWPAHLCFALMLPGIVALCWGMGVHDVAWIWAGAVLVCAGLSVFAVLTADNLRRATSLPVVSAHGWLALAALIGAAALAVLLIRDYGTGDLADRGAFVVLHLILAAFGFMGALVLGLSLVLIPMFVLSRSPVGPMGWAQFGFAALALAAAIGALLAGLGWLIWPALGAGVAALCIHLWAMLGILRGRMRKRLGLPFVLIRAAWGFLILAMLLILARHAGLPVPNAPPLIMFSLLAGWLLTYLCGVLQRILPFLASMHAAGTGGLPPLLSELASDGPLRLHAACHFPALALCGAGIAADLPILLRLGAGLGAIGALGLASFAFNISRKLSATR